MVRRHRGRALARSQPRLLAEPVVHRALRSRRHPFVVAGAIALLAGGCGDRGGSPSPQRGARDRLALANRSGAELSIVNRDRLLAGTRWQSRADSIGTWPLGRSDQARLPSLRDCSRGAEIGWAFRRIRPLGNSETDIAVGQHGWVGIMEMFAPLQSLGADELEQAMRDGVARCASGRPRVTRPLAGRWHETILDGRPASWRVCRSAGAWHAVLYQARVSGIRRDVLHLVHLIRRRVDTSCET